jgi:hypothetical protein
MSTLYVMFDVQVYCECMYKSIDGLMVSNSVEVEFECVRLSVNCVHNVFNSRAYSTCTVAGPKPFINHIVRASSYTLSLRALAYILASYAIEYMCVKRVLQLLKKLCAKKFRTEFYIRERFCSGEILRCGFIKGTTYSFAQVIS